MSDNCQCGKKLIQATGDPGGKVILVGDRPGFEEYRTGYVLTGPTGNVLNAELQRLGLARSAVRVTNLWGHEPDEKSQDEKDRHVRRLIAELKGKTAAFFMGADCAWEFAGMGVTEIFGISVYPKSSRAKDGYKSGLLPSGLKFAVFSPNPAIVLQRSNMAVIGEFRDALSYFVGLCQKEKLL